MAKKKDVKKEAKEQPKKEEKKESTIKKPRLIEKQLDKLKGIDRKKATRILLWVAVAAFLITLLAYYFPRGTLEVKSVEGFDTPVANVEVWIWDMNDFEGKPEKTFTTDENGVARIKLFRGEYVVALQQELLPKNDPPVKYKTVFEIKRGKTLSLNIAVQG